MDRGIIDVPSSYSVPETLARLESILKERGVTVFARLDHSGEAEKAGLKMRPTQLLIFGSPKGGTPVMVEAREHRHAAFFQNRFQSRQGFRHGVGAGHIDD